MSTDGDSTEVLIYAGRRTGSGNKIVYGYRSTLDESMRYYSDSLGNVTTIGAMVEITHPDGEATSYYSKGADGPRGVGFAGHLPADVVLDWQVADRAAYAVKADADAIKRAAKRADHLGHNIDALTAAARNLTSYERAAFARYVADRIRGL
jgi:hypothetical protein